jgi:hypothetical protein
VSSEPAHVATAVVEAIRQFAGTTSFADDVSLVVFDWMG